ncbi:MAG: hypothetical protein IKO52_05540 [Clostridia bacterium]|nr:hypothetical protein [Clostridia bacterium]
MDQGKMDRKERRADGDLRHSWAFIPEEQAVAVWGDYLLRIVLGMAITAFIFTLIGKLKVGNKATDFLGSISYEVYLIQRAAFIFMATVVSDGINSGLYVLLSVCLTIVISYCMKLVSKPLIQKITNLGYSGQS